MSGDSVMSVAFLACILTLLDYLICFIGSLLLPIDAVSYFILSFCIDGFGGDDDWRGKRKMDEPRDKQAPHRGRGRIAASNSKGRCQRQGEERSVDLGGGELGEGWLHHSSWCLPSYSSLGRVRWRLHH